MSITRTIEPTRIAQGEELEWTRTFDDYPATEYTLEYRFRGPATGFNITATADGEGFHAEIEANAFTSSAAAVGRWMWQAWATEIADPDHVEMIRDGFLQVSAGFVTGTVTAVELRSPAKIQLDAIDAALLAFNTSDVQEYEIATPAGTRRVKRSDKAQMIEQRKYWAKIVAQEAAKERVKNGGSFATEVRLRHFER
jgi:hypothetical protein